MKKLVFNHFTPVLEINHGYRNNHTYNIEKYDYAICISELCKYFETEEAEKISFRISSKPTAQSVSFVIINSHGCYHYRRPTEKIRNDFYSPAEHWFDGIPMFRKLVNGESITIHVTLYIHE